eukprot:4621042-Prymnesium_polylepis.1
MRRWHCRLGFGGGCDGSLVEYAHSVGTGLRALARGGGTAGSRPSQARWLGGGRGGTCNALPRAGCRLVASCGSLDLGAVDVWSVVFRDLSSDGVSLSAYGFTFYKTTWQAVAPPRTAGGRSSCRVTSCAAS